MLNVRFFSGQFSSTAWSSQTLLDVDRPRNYYKCFVSRDIEAEIIHVCQLLGYYGDVQLLVDHFLELFAKSAVYRKQAAFCLNEVITGTARPPTVRPPSARPPTVIPPTMTSEHTQAETTSADIDCIVR